MCTFKILPMLYEATENQHDFQMWLVWSDLIWKTFISRTNDLKQKSLLELTITIFFFCLNCMQQFVFLFLFFLYFFICHSSDLVFFCFFLFVIQVILVIHFHKYHSLALQLLWCVCGYDDILFTHSPICNKIPSSFTNTHPDMYRYPPMSVTHRLDSLIRQWILISIHPSIHSAWIQVSNPRGQRWAGLQSNNVFNMICNHNLWYKVNMLHFPYSLDIMLHFLLSTHISRCKHTFLSVDAKKRFHKWFIVLRISTEEIVLFYFEIHAMFVSWITTQQGILLQPVQWNLCFTTTCLLRQEIVAPTVSPLKINRYFTTTCHLQPK